ncbi:hypothetical protein OIO90_006484 [Microbotryomycetes sp. JL221]|nr:hypothetical protein OIO90_006484 [Microbotryomycetes sp. JL221]
MTSLEPRLAVSLLGPGRFSPPSQIDRMLSHIARARQPLSRVVAQRRTYASEPVNVERGSSKTPLFMIGAAAVLFGGYMLGTKGTPNTPAVEGLVHATHPKTPDAKDAAGFPDKPQQRSSQAGEQKK